MWTGTPAAGGRPRSASTRPEAPASTRIGNGRASTRGPDRRRRRNQSAADRTPARRDGHAKKH